MLAHRLRRWSNIDPFSAGADLDGSEFDVYNEKSIPALKEFKMNNGGRPIT